MIDRLSVDLQRAFPGQQGFSPRNLKYMRAFAKAWPETVIVQPPVAQLTGAKKSGPAIVQARLARISASMSPIVQAPLPQLSWYVTKLVETLPKSLKGAVPSVVELEKGLTRK